MPPRLVCWASLWSLTHYPSARREWTLARKIAAVKAAGFDGFNAILNPEMGALREKHGLEVLGLVWSPQATEFKELIASQVSAGATHMNCMFAEHDTPHDKAFRLMKKMLREAERQKVWLGVEIHRNTATETPEKFFALADRYQRETGKLLPCTWDFSHWGVVKQMSPSLSDRFFVRPDLIQHSRLFHFRPFSASHAQIPTRDARGRETREFGVWLEFAEKLMRLWLAGPRPGGAFHVVPEFGPAHDEYETSTFPNSWDEACYCVNRFRQLWAKCLHS